MQSGPSLLWGTFVPADGETPAKVEALDLLRQGIAPVENAEEGSDAAKKRPRTEQDDMRVPSQTRKKPHADADFAAVPDS